MTTTRKKIITIATRQRTVIRQTSRRTFWCEFCDAEVLAATPEQSAAISDTGLREIYRSMENGKLHFIESETGVPQICLHSLKSYKKQEIKKYGVTN